MSRDPVRHDNVQHDATADMTPHAASEGLREAVARKGSFAQTLKAVAWSFFGVRKSADHAKDVAQLNPVHVIVAGVFAAAWFVVVLVGLVRWVVGSGIAS